VCDTTDISVGVTPGRVLTRAKREPAGRRRPVSHPSQPLPAGIPADQADAHFGFLGALVQMDNPTSSAVTQRLLGWHPAHPGLIEDLAESHYFET
jgi:hypothetical protein